MGLGKRHGLETDTDISVNIRRHFYCNVETKGGDNNNVLCLFLNIAI